MRRGVFAFALGQEAWDEVQRRALYRAEGRGGCLFGGREGADPQHGGQVYENARYILEGLKSAGYEVYGGVNSPYVWMKTPGQMGSWEFFDYLLERANVVGTPGAGFGPSGEGYFRLTAFGSYENTVEAVERIKEI